MVDRMKPAERREWIMQHASEIYRLTKANYTYNVLDRFFVEKYCCETGASFIPTMLGADKCPMLGKDLSTLCNHGRLKRSRVGIGGIGIRGFPTWVWDYSLSESSTLAIDKETA